MARSSSNALPFVTLGVVVVAAAFGVGYFVLGGPRTTAQPPQVSAPVQTPPPAPVKANTAPPHVTPRARNADYTAPNAPRIQIVEERTPTLTRRASPASRDPEASQEAAPPLPVTTPDTTAPPADAATDTSSGTDTPPPPDSLNPPDTSPAPDSEGGQEGAKALFRVQTGSFAAQPNAKALADALRSRGYVTSTRAEQQGSRTVYKVQIGAYRTKAAADKAALDLQKEGYPAYTSPIASVPLDHNAPRPAAN